MDNIRQIVTEFVLDNFALATDFDALSAETDLQEQGILDSLAALRLMSFLEDRFHVKVAIEDLEAGSLFSIAGIERLVESRLRA